MSEEAYQAAQTHTKNGWVIHPLTNPKDSGNSPGKKPILPNWQNRETATESELKEWFLKNDYNIGLVCGEKSGIIVIDLDKMDWLGALFPPEEEIINKTLISGRTDGRGHIYFQYDKTLSNLKLHDFGIEILSTGSNVVIPPSIHKEGQQYKFKNPKNTPQKIPNIVKKNITLLKSFVGKVKECRPCIQHIIFQSNDAMHGNDGRRLMLMVSTELKAHDVAVDELLLYARKVYTDKFDSTRTKTEYKNCDPEKTWQCTTIAENFPDLARMCQQCPKKTLEKDYIDVATMEKAVEIMSKGKPIEYILDVWNKIHIGDRPFGYVLLCSMVSSSILNSDGIQINFNGDSGGGKSHACRSMLHLLPKKYWSKKSLSNKALFYTQSIKPDMVLFSDDVILSDDIKTVYKNSVSDFQEEVEHETVDIQRKALTLKVPCRLTWWLTAVLDPGNNEVERRNLKIVISPTPERTTLISGRLYERKSKGEAKYPEYPEVFICRAILKQIKEAKESVIIPFKIRFKDVVGLDTQNIIYELIYATTLLNKMQRHRNEEGKIISDIADFYNVCTNFHKISDTQISKFTKSELAVAVYLKAEGQHDGKTSNEIQERFGKSKGWVSQIMNGKNGSGGLLTKMGNIIEEEVTIKDGEMEMVRKKRYKFVGKWDELAIYDSVAEVIE